MSSSCSNSLGHRFEGLAKLWIDKSWIGRFSMLPIASGQPLGDYLDGRTTTVPRKRGGSELLAGGTGGIDCRIRIGHEGEVEVRLAGLPDCLRGTRPFLGFPAAASVAGISWAPGPQMGIVHSGEIVSARGDLRCLVARSRSKIEDLPRLFRLVGIFSEQGNSQPDCSIRMEMQRLGARG